MTVYILVDESHNIVAVYNAKDLAEKMRPVIKAKLEVEELTIVAKNVNPDIKIIGGQ